MTIKAPFNFVPLSDKVFFPDWADKVTHDIPFSDGESGSLIFDIKVESPIFVRNGYSRNISKDDPKYLHFNNITGKFFIPSTTLKGAIRNVLEIASFGKMDKISNDRYSIRDLQLKKYLSFFQGSDVHCGFMTKADSHNVVITDHGIPRRISHSDLDKYWGTRFTEIFKDSELLKNEANRIAVHKIKLAQNKPRQGTFTEMQLNPANAVDKRIKVKYDSEGTFKGTIVLTGQPGIRKERIANKDGSTLTKGQGKFYEFVFPDNQINSFSLNTEEAEGIYRDFCFVYKDSEDWKYWKKELDKGHSVPVFFSRNGDTLLHFGLSYLYKLPFQKRIKEYLPESHRIGKPDLAECIFGNINKDYSLKGRVQFSHCFLESGSVASTVLKPYMGSPKPTYYPIYIVQDGANGIPGSEFVTMLQKNARLKGWKRYPVHEEVKPFMIPLGVKEEHLNPFIPINPGSVFSCVVRFHNLRKAEIGALLYASGISENFSHSLGFAKPYGYGKVRMEFRQMNGCKFEKAEYISSFKELMENAIPGFSKSTQINELRLMGIAQTTTSPLEYMELKEFVDCKKQNIDRSKFGEYLEYYSKLIKNKDVDKPHQDTLDTAEILLFKHPVFQARLLSGKDLTPKDIVDYPAAVRLKPGDKIVVNKIMKGSNVIRLQFVKKL